MVKIKKRNESALVFFSNYIPSHLSLKIVIILFLATHLSQTIDCLFYITANLTQAAWITIEI